MFLKPLNALLLQAGTHGFIWNINFLEEFVSDLHNRLFQFSKSRFKSETI